MRIQPFVACISLACTLSVSAQCGQWGSGPEFAHVNRYAYSTAEWDPDGAGPLGNRLVVAGDFQVAGGVLATNIASWDGTQWRPIGPGITGEVAKVLNVGGYLWAVRRYSARPLVFDGVTWVNTACPSPTNGDSTWPSFAIEPGELFQTDGTNLYVAYAYAPFGGTPWLVAKWTGNAWVYYPGSLPGGTSPYNVVRSLAIQNGNPVIGGTFTTINGSPMNHIARWNGTGWEEVGGGTDNTVTLIHAFAPSQLVISGLFTHVGGGLPTNQVAVWTGSRWWTLQTINPGGRETFGVSVGSRVILCGAPISGNNSGIGIAGSGIVWDGSTFQSAAHAGPFAPYNGSAYALSYSEMAATANGTSWSVIRPSTVRRPGALAEVGGVVYATSAWPAPYLVRKSPVGWEAASYGLCGQPYALCRYGQDLAVAGEVTECASPLPPRGVGIRNTQTGNWHMLPGAFANPGLQTLSMRCLTEWNGKLFVGGSFSSISGLSVGCVAAWNGTAWESLMGGVTGSSNSVVTGLVATPEGVVATGYFTSAGGVPVRNMARWDGSAWESLGSAENPAFDEVGYFQNMLLRSATVQGPVYNESVLQAWNGAGWMTVMTDLPLSVTSIGELNGELVVSGYASPSSSDAFHGIARWDGSQWSSFGTGVGGGSNAGNASTTMTIGNVLASSGSVYVTGEFSSAGSVGANGLAEFTPGDGPRVTINTDSPVACADGIVVLHATTDGTPPFTYSWGRSGSALAAGPGIAAYIFGADSPMLTIIDPQPGIAGRYYITVRDACGAARSAPLTLTYGGPSCAQACDPIDFNNDGLFPDTEDIQTFIRVFAGGPCDTSTNYPPMPCNDIDFNNDTLSPDTDDLAAFLRVVAGGTCEP